MQRSLLRVLRNTTGQLARMNGQRSLASQAEFEAAKERLNDLSDRPGNQEMLKLYALFKQATTGECTTKRPSMMDMVGRAKHDAWSSLGSMTKEDAMSGYIGVVDGLLAAAGVSGGAAESGSSSSGNENVVVEKKGNVQVIRLNRPKKFNALLPEMYAEITRVLNETSDDKSVKVTVLTATGDYYCSGNDLGNFANINPSEIGKVASAGREMCQSFVDAFIDHKKPLVALINGPAVGISVTVLGLCDAVIAKDTATFHTPFPQVGQTPEGCSSYTFPRMMGTPKAVEVLLGRKLTAQEAFDRNLVSALLPAAEFESKGWAMVEAMAKLPPNALTISKRLMRAELKDTLHRVNAEECATLEQVWQSDECINAIMAFFSRKSNL